ncbi:MAG: hypothetical protein ACRCTR_09310 [Actinomycetota bacterium]
MPEKSPKAQSGGIYHVPRLASSSTTSGGVTSTNSYWFDPASGRGPVPVLSGIVRDAAKGKGNFGVGSGTASQATRAGESWVGDGYRIASDGKTLVNRPAR